LPDPLYLNLWFPQFTAIEILPRTLSIMQQFPFSDTRPGVTYLSLHPVSWDEATVLERRFEPGIDPGAAVSIASDLLHQDYAYLFEAFWDLWLLEETTQEWILQPSRVRFIAHGTDFDEQTYRENGHVQVDLGLDSPFLHEEVRLTPFNDVRVRANIQKLVEFTMNVEKNTGLSGRILWSESDENLAQKLISRLQRVQ
jgi:hypothetical protein